MTQEYRCPNGHPVRYGARFCDECGVQLSWLAVDKEPPPQPRARDFFKDFSWTGCIVVFGVLFAIYIMAQCAPSFFSSGIK